MRALCGLYAGPRAVSFNGAGSRAFEAGGTILPGCSCATTMARVILVRLLRGISAAYPSVDIKNVVDDVSMQAMGTVRHTALVMGRVGLQFHRGMVDLRLPLFCKKTVFATNDSELAKRLEATWQQVGFKRKSHTRSWGGHHRRQGQEVSHCRCSAARGPEEGSQAEAAQEGRWKHCQGPSCWAYRDGCLGNGCLGVSRSEVAWTEDLCLEVAQQSSKGHIGGHQARLK